jgi:hypothetical protein
LTITICHSASDLESAGELQRYLLENFGGDVCRRVIEGSVREAVDFALSGDRVVVLLSPDAIPRVEDGWEEVLLHEHVFYVLIRECRFPPLIQRNRTRFADGRPDRLAAYRAAKRWLLGGRPASEREMNEDLRRELADKPGFAERDFATAARFAEQAVAEFEDVLFIDGRGRTLPSVLHETRTAIGDRARVLIIMRGAGREFVEALPVPPFSSVLTTTYEHPPNENAHDVRGQLSEALNGRAEVNEAAFDRALQASSDPDFIRLAASWLERNGRLQEALAALDSILKQPALSDLARQRSWIQEKLSGTVQAPVVDPRQAEQLMIPFA